jgi:hypothetical protein
MGSRRDEGGGFLRSVGGEPAEEQRGGVTGDARRRRDLRPAAAIWQRRETKPVWAGAGPSGLQGVVGRKLFCAAKRK